MTDGDVEMLLHIRPYGWEVYFGLDSQFSEDRGVTDTGELQNQR